MWGGAPAAIGKDDIGQVFMAEGAIVHSMVHGREDFGLSIKIHQSHNLFNMMGDVDLGAAHGLEVVFCRISQGYEGIPMLKEGGIGF